MQVCRNPLMPSFFSNFYLMARYNIYLGLPVALHGAGIDCWYATNAKRCLWLAFTAIAMALFYEIVWTGAEVTPRLFTLRACFLQLGLLLFTAQLMTFITFTPSVGLPFVLYFSSSAYVFYTAPTPIY